MYRKIATFAASLMLISLMVSCMARPVAVATASSPLLSGTRGTRYVRGESCQYYLLGLLPISAPLSTHSAMEEAKQSKSVEVLTDITVDQVIAHFILFSSNCVRVEALGVPEG